MATRSILAEITPNRRRGCQLSSEQKSRIIAHHVNEKSYGEIALLESLPRATVQSTLRRIKARRSLDNKPRSGRPKIYSDQDERAIVRTARLQPKLTY